MPIPVSVNEMKDMERIKTGFDAVLKQKEEA